MMTRVEEGMDITEMRRRYDQLEMNMMQISIWGLKVFADMGKIRPGCHHCENWTPREAKN